MQLSFGNMTVEMNVFNLCKHSIDHNDVDDEKACLIEALTQDHRQRLLESNIEKFFTLNKEENVEVVTNWQEKYDIYILNNIDDSEDSTKENVEMGKAKLKPLPHG